MKLEKFAASFLSLLMLALSIIFFWWAWQMTENPHLYHAASLVLVGFVGIMTEMITDLISPFPTKKVMDTEKRLALHLYLMLGAVVIAALAKLLYGVSFIAWCGSIYLGIIGAFLLWRTYLMLYCAFKQPAKPLERHLPCTPNGDD